LPRFYEPDLGADSNSPFARDASDKLVRRSYWLDMADSTLVLVMTKGIGAHLTNDEKRALCVGMHRVPFWCAVGVNVHGGVVKSRIIETPRLDAEHVWKSL
jgi:hypothetical protein